MSDNPFPAEACFGEVQTHLLNNVHYFKVTWFGKYSLMKKEKGQDTGGMI